MPGNKEIRISQLFFWAFLLGFFIGNAQIKYEREHRIKKSQFPEEAIQFISDKLEGTKRMKFYKEIDSSRRNFKAKLKKDRLWYGLEFTESGKLENIEILVSEVDVPSDTYEAILNYLGKSYSKYRIKKIHQQYGTSEMETLENTLKNAFQNLILPSVNYEVIVRGKKEGGYTDYEIIFNANGEFIRLRQSLPPNYDHTLY
jgi:aspartate-semialdehyde dehydrogenase